ncbi:hypothetical protein LSCM1_08057 [Leishmania martiniquensis]|uniref:Uncharacterized protein n=1 Tax=Leishmania martiniquensis TaxID=1580590 RepID=A0A836H8A8_9TRYP|nr:hypothetical protein LSCM1_08057 [Leishmania martiniquensis]
MSSPDSSPTVAVAGGCSREGASLEKDVALLMAALRINNGDEWEGKPQQETFRMFEGGPPVGEARPSSCSAEVAQWSGGLPARETDTRDDNSDSLNALMKDYVLAVHGLHLFDAQMAADGVCESATGERDAATDGAVVVKEEATVPSKAAADDSSSSATGVNLAEVAVLDRLPSITGKGKGEQC